MSQPFSLALLLLLLFLLVVVLLRLLPRLFVLCRRFFLQRGARRPALPSPSPLLPPSLLLLSSSTYR